MDTRTASYYRDHRPGNPAHVALSIARSLGAADRAWFDADPDFGDGDAEGYTWREGDASVTFRIWWGDWYGVEDWNNPDAYPIAERATDNRRRGMARGPAWDAARDAYNRDRDRMNGWQDGVLSVHVELPDGSVGDAVMSTPLNDADDTTTLAFDVMLGDRMVAEATAEARRNARQASNAALPRMVRRPERMVA